MKNRRNAENLVLQIGGAILLALTIAVLILEKVGEIQRELSKLKKPAEQTVAVPALTVPQTANRANSTVQEQ